MYKSASLILSNTALINHLNDYMLSENGNLDSFPSYILWENPEGKWYIQRENPQYTLRYARGDSDPATAWTNRATQVYNRYSVEFNEF